MKKDYKREPAYRSPHKLVYKHRHARYHRSPVTHQANRQACAELYDRELRDLNVRPRGRRRKIVTAWDDLNRGRNYKKSWKDFTKKRKQWEK